MENAPFEFDQLGPMDMDEAVAMADFLSTWCGNDVYEIGRTVMEMNRDFPEFRWEVRTSPELVVVVEQRPD